MYSNGFDMSYLPNAKFTHISFEKLINLWSVMNKFQWSEYEVKNLNFMILLTYLFRSFPPAIHANLILLTYQFHS